MLAFGISTQNRKGMFFEVLEAVYKYAPEDSVVVIHDDGSTDGTQQAMKEWMFQHIRGPAVVFLTTDKILGVAKAKNALVKYFLGTKWETPISDVFLIEDDVLPMVDGWWKYFLDCAWEHKQAHLLFLPTLQVGGKYGTTLATTEGDNPITWKTHCSGLVMYFRQELLLEMKGFEERFGRYGYDHNELTSRCLVAQMQDPAIYPHCVKTESEFALLSRDMEAERQNKILPSSTADDSPKGNRTKAALARQNKALYDELMAKYRAAYGNVARVPEHQKLAHRHHYYFRGPRYAY